MLATTQAFAVICKSVDADGVVSYSEVPAAECPEVVKLPDYSRYTPRPVTPPTNEPNDVVEAPAVEQPFTGYDRIAITEPEPNGTVRSNDGIVQVGVTLQPSLQPGHRIKLFLDGGAVAGEFDGPAIQLSGVERGTHSLRAVVSDESGRRLGDSPSIRFTLRQISLYDRERIDPPPGVVPPLEPGQPVNPIEPAPANPVERPTNLQPNPAQFGTPGAANPAFAPNFSR